MDNEIIIDGVNVAGCCNNRCVGVDADGEKLYLCDEYIDGGCERHNCYYKQLKRLEQENARLKEEISQTKCPFFFKHTAICLGRKDDMQRYEKCTSYQNCNIKRMAQNNKNYKQVLQEIKEIAERELSLTDKDDELWEVFSEILQKIAQASRVRSVGVGLREQDEQDTETRLMRAQQDAECEVDNER